MGPGKEILGVFGWVERRKASQPIVFSDERTIGNGSGVPRVLSPRSFGRWAGKGEPGFFGWRDKEDLGGRFLAVFGDFMVAEERCVSRWRRFRKIGRTPPP
jgi:hypothetical protein